MRIYRDGTMVVAKHFNVGVGVERSELPSDPDDARDALWAILESRLQGNGLDPDSEIDELASLPGWATWSPHEARDNVRAMLEGATTVAEMKDVLIAILPRMAMVLMYLLREILR